MTCLSSDQLARIAEDAAPASLPEGWQAHVAVCERCQERLHAARARAHDEATKANNTNREERTPAMVPTLACTVDFTAKETPAQPQLPTDTIPGYTVIEEIHRGGQGVVFKAVQNSTKRIVALKVLLHGPYATGKQRLRFEREVDLVASLRHAHIVTIYDSGMTSVGLCYFAMEYVHGAALDRYLQARALTMNEKLQLFLKICLAVNYAHQRGVTHRDLKPGNIRIDSAGEPRLLDFGLAKTANPMMADDGEPITRTGEFMGTLAYASPEQAQGDPSRIDIRTDVYSLGVILFQMLTGGFPYPVTGSVTEVLRAISEKDPEPPSRVLKRNAQSAGGKPPKIKTVDAGLDAIVLKALAKDRDQRYQSAGALAEDIQRLLAGEPIAARTASLTFVLRAWLGQYFRNAHAVVWIILIGIATGLGGPIGPVLLAIDPVISRMRETYSKFPTLNPPRFLQLGLFDTAGDLSGSPTALISVTLLCYIGAILMLLMGPIVAAVVRSRSRLADCSAGFTAGLVAGATAAMTSLGPLIVVATALAPMMATLRLWAGAANEPHAPAGLSLSNDRLVHLFDRYPDLQSLPDRERTDAALRIMSSEHVAGVFSAFWLKIPVIVLAFATYGGITAMVGGILLRREERLGTVVSPFVEIAITAMVTCIASLYLFDESWRFDSGISPNDRLALSVAWFVLTCLAVRYRCRSYVRFVLHFVCMALQLFAWPG